MFDYYYAFIEDDLDMMRIPLPPVTLHRGRISVREKRYAQHLYEVNPKLLDAAAPLSRKSRKALADNNITPAVEMEVERRIIALRKQKYGEASQAHQ